MEELRAETVRGTTYILKTESQEEAGYVRGECFRLGRDGTLQGLGKVAVLQSTLEVGKNIVIIVSAGDSQRTLVTSDVAAIQRQRI